MARGSGTGHLPDDLRGMEGEHEKGWRLTAGREPRPRGSPPPPLRKSGNNGAKSGRPAAVAEWPPGLSAWSWPSLPVWPWATPSGTAANRTRPRRPPQPRTRPRRRLHPSTPPPSSPTPRRRWITPANYGASTTGKRTPPSWTLTWTRSRNGAFTQQPATGTRLFFAPLWLSATPKAASTRTP